MTIIESVPVAAAVLFLAYSVFVGARDGGRIQNGWVFPATASCLFLLFSLGAVAAEGMLGFWADHTGSLWGNQIWMDLLLAVGIAWYFVVPQARALGMRPLPWLLLIACTGCIGFLAMTARLMYLRERAALHA